eukprot:TRINITY_DN2019_c0_g2_i15.p1 TRINITY_DN2019_c0_g2~~TRINITY_DN2019_c0_g2_i15.p1  ORF type:complete len:440 (+),score=75.61 TRINITY_DN2019_c0_g2_i15:116-1435(+)
MTSTTRIGGQALPTSQTVTVTTDRQTLPTSPTVELTTQALVVQSIDDILKALQNVNMCSIEIEQATEYLLQLVQKSERTYTLTPKTKSRVNEQETHQVLRQSEESLERLYSTPEFTIDFTTAVIEARSILHPEQVINTCHGKFIAIPSEKKKWLKDCEVEAIILYSFEYNHPEEKKYSPYKLLNQALMSNSTEELKSLKGIIWLLFSGLRKLPKVYSEQFLPSKRFYRGITVPIDYSAYSPGETVLFHGFTSTTTEVNVTLSFMKNQQSENLTGTLFHFCDAWGYILQDFSLFKQEFEVVLEPGSSFQVISLIKKASPVIVELCMKQNVPLLLSSILDCWSNVDNWECTLSEMNAVVGRIGSLKPIYQEKLFLSLVTDEKLMSDLERLQVDSLEKLLSFFKEQCIMKQCIFDFFFFFKTNKNKCLFVGDQLKQVVTSST